MKKMNWFLVVIMLFGACFAACTDDDDKDPNFMPPDIVMVVLGMESPLL